MIPALRHHLILQCLQRSSPLTLQALARQIPVSLMTLRRDIAVLAKQGVLKQIRGGIATVETPSTPSVVAQYHPGLMRQALRQIREETSIFLDSGPLARALAQQISWQSGMTALTNDLQLAEQMMADTPAQVRLLAGELQRSDRTCQGPLAVSSLDRTGIQLAFLTPVSWDHQGVWHHDPHRKPWYQSLLQTVQRSVLLAACPACQRKPPFQLYRTDQPSLILTDCLQSEISVQPSLTAGKWLYCG